MERSRTASLIAAVSALVAVVTLLIAVIDARHRSQEAQLHEWQKVVVFSIIEREGARGASFEQVRSRYREEAQAFAKFDVPKEEIAEQALQRILLGLLADRAIVHSLGRTYQTAIAQPFPEFLLRRAQRFNEVGDRIMAILTTEGCRYRFDQLRAKLSEIFQFNPGEFEGITAALTSQGVIGLNQQGLVCFAFRP